MNSHNENTKSILEVEKAHSHDWPSIESCENFVIWLKMTVISRAPH